jgi:VWFA-related protein
MSSRRASFVRLEEVMCAGNRIGLLLLVALLQNPAARAQQDNSASQHPRNSVDLDVVVAEKSGSLVTGLSQQDFTLLDNKIPQTITSFRELGGGEAPAEVMVVIDGVNAKPQTIAYERDQIRKFLSANAGRLPHPTSFAVVTDADTRIHPGFTTDGSALNAALNDEIVSINRVTRAAGYEGSTDRIQLSLKAMDTIAAYESARPGRKLVLWVSPGWPLLFGTTIQVTSLQREQMFADIVSLSTRLRQARITLYSIDPLGTRDIGLRTSAYTAYVKGVSKPKEVEIGNVALQVFAVNSGGLALNSGNDLAELLQRCLNDTEAYYVISFEAPAAGRRDEYHHLEVQLAKPGLRARTRQNYYAQPATATNTTTVEGPQTYCAASAQR